MSEVKEIKPNDTVIVFIDGEDMIGVVNKIPRGTAHVTLDNGTVVKCKVKDLNLATARDIAIHRPGKIEMPEFVVIPNGKRVVVTGDKGECVTGTVIEWSGDMYQVEIEDGIIWHKPPSEVELLNPLDDDNLSTKERKELEDQDSETGPKTSMAQALTSARKTYRAVKKENGKSSADCGDLVAIALENLTPVEVANLCDEVCSSPKGHHATAYSTLNPGQMRMNSGNKIRARYRKAIKDENMEEVERIRKILGVPEMDRTAAAKK